MQKTSRIGEGERALISRGNKEALAENPRRIPPSFCGWRIGNIYVIGRSNENPRDYLVRNDDIKRTYAVAEEALVCAYLRREMQPPKWPEWL